MKKLALKRTTALVGALVAIGAASPVLAQDSGEDEEGSRGRAVNVEPYIEVSQIAIAELSPGDDVVTYTQIAAGIDASITGRNNGGSVSLRYERNIGYGDDSIDSDTISGVARGYASIIPQVLTVEAGALAAKTRVDGNGASNLASLDDRGTDSQIYSAYAGPTLSTRAGDVEVNANYRIGYTRVEAPDGLVTAPGATPIDVFDDSVSQSAKVHLATRPGEPLPVGVGVGAGWNQEDISNLDQRFRDVYVRGDVSLPVTPSLALVAGVGYEDVEASSRDAVRDVNGDPVIGVDGRFVTDSSQPRQLAYDVSGLIWDAGVIWRPSNRTSLTANVGRRYDSTSYYGSLSYAPNSRSSLAVSVYDTVSGFGNQLNTALANLPTEFTAGRNPLTGGLGGCVSGQDGANCLNGALGSVRSSVFRSRGVAASYSTNIGRLNAGVGAGYDRRRFIATPGSVLAAADGVTDESYYAALFLSGEVGQRGNFSTNAYYNYFNSGFDQAGDVTAIGASAAYNHSISSRLSARAAIAVDSLDSDVSDEDFTAASALVGLRFGF
ncbi:preprotein translocase subunit YajC [Pontixanthobacter aestiaquae]|uniref:Preprotein translocase subunit YajC n=1 Tax=Pontixanthobacter aestiaquae TaxID=1509367 RepID=A0A844ZD46_9SPHN|nr:preprotein translocase subunit YajC [Pontixanthobacter aestiaquae]MDN3645279.1 preprotein translocase subunit YajC [Pontixanthobacter aestiaquae]MXO83719.1 preprotein translocase subunit YajC [Pontixanthobacter aestiaquae]